MTKIIVFSLAILSQALVYGQGAQVVRPALPGFDKEVKKVYKKSNVDYAAFLALAHEVDEYRADRLVAYDEWLAMSKEPNTVILDTRSKEAYDKIHINGAIHLDFSDFTDYKLRKVIPNKSTRVLIYCANNFHGNSRLTRAGGAAGPKGPEGPQGNLHPDYPKNLVGPQGPKKAPKLTGSNTNIIGPSLPTPKSLTTPKKTNKPSTPKKTSESQNNIGVVAGPPPPPTPKMYSKGPQRPQGGSPGPLIAGKSPVALNIPSFINLYYYGYKNVYELSSSIDTKDKDLELVGTTHLWPTSP